MTHCGVSESQYDLKYFTWEFEDTHFCSELFQCLAEFNEEEYPNDLVSELFAMTPARFKTYMLARV